MVLKFDASSLPVCLVTVKGQGLTETQLHDYAQFAIRNQIAVVKGAEIPPPFGGKYRQAMVYVDPYKLLSRQMTPMDVVDAVNQSNLILPAGRREDGPLRLLRLFQQPGGPGEGLEQYPHQDGGDIVGDGGRRGEGRRRQSDSVQHRAGGRPEIVLHPHHEAGGDTNTIEVVNGVRDLIGHLFDIPKQMTATLVFDQSVFVKEAIKTVLHEGLIGLLLTSIMILLFLGSFRATSAVFLSIPLSALATFVVLYSDGQHREHHDSGGPGAGLFARDRQFRDLARKHLSPSGDGRLCRGGGPRGGRREVNLAVLAATLVAVVDFFPVIFLYGVSKFLFSALALAVCISLLRPRRGDDGNSRCSARVF